MKQFSCFTCAYPWPTERFLGILDDLQGGFWPLRCLAWRWTMPRYHSAILPFCHISDNFELHTSKSSRVADPTSENSYQQPQFLDGGYLVNIYFACPTTLIAPGLKMADVANSCTDCTKSYKVFPSKIKSLRLMRHSAIHTVFLLRGYYGHM
jgi:hypothetical protein